MAIISITFSFRLIIAVLVLLEVESSFIISSSSVTFHKNAKQNGIYCRCQRPICAADGTASNEPVEKKKKTSVKRKPAKSKRSAKAAVQMEFMAVDGTAFEESAAAGDLLNYEEGTLKSNSLAAQLDPTSMDSSDNRDDVEANDDCATAVESPAAIAFPATSAASGEMKTMAGQTHHFRHHCKKKSFVPLTEFVFKCEARYIPRWAMIGKDGNAEICNQCYCFVCDKPAKDCERWSSVERSTAFYNHCQATDEGVHTDEWNEIRQLYKDQNWDSISHLEQLTPKLDLDSFARDEKEKPVSLPAELRVGAFPPTDQRASPFFRLLTKCRKCGWYSYTAGNRRVKRSNEYVESRPADWCQGCGRIASEKYLKMKCKCLPYEPNPDDIFLGTRTIPFRIKVHDPRKMEMFRKNWAELEGNSPQWTYDEAEAEEDMFRNRFGAYPSLAMILSSIPVLREEKIPTDGTYAGWNIYSVKYHMEQDKDSNWPYEGHDAGEMWKKVEQIQATVRAEDTDVVLMDRNSKIILQELYKLRSAGVFPADIIATWNKKERHGVFVVRVFYAQNRRFTLGSFLRAWFGVPIFRLPSLAYTLKAYPCDVACSFNREDQFLSEREEPYPPFVLSNDTEKAVIEAGKLEMNKAVDAFNNEIGLFRDKLLLQPSEGNGTSLGAVCSTDTSFEGLLHRYFSSILPEHISTRTVYEYTLNTAYVSWVGRAAGVTSYHRIMCSNLVDWRRRFQYITLESFIRDQDIPLAFMNCVDKGNGDVLLNLENLGHEEAPFVEGLNVELLPFQRQTLQWALERETTPGGLYSFLLARLPLEEHVYYDPLFESLSYKKPKLVRGGIIADEMGLGKTVVSLALILQNPAPSTPESGSKAKIFRSGLKSNAGNLGWDRNWQLGDRYNPLKAAIISRGTLVVCHVSLVSQWIEEAKSKLENPGLVYAYHGQNRKRDAMILARNSIIVTTYATLVSDANYHADKALNNGDTGYCPPCEQIRWWRIICDESHTLKHDTLQTKAVMNLVGDHKWCVSGTPWGTSLLDVRNQLKFIGLENMDKLFLDFQNAIFVYWGKRPFDQRTHGHFMFLMRTVLIRHSQKQRYRGTSTTLMSLPPKTERTMIVDFEPHEATEYARLQKEALDFYRTFRFDFRVSFYFKLTQKLRPLRIACAGGRIPHTVDSSTDDEDDDESDDELTEEPKTRTFVGPRFQSKFNALIRELERIRDNEPGSKSLVFSQYASSLTFLQEELPKHGFEFRTLTGDMTLKQRAEALHAFKSDPPTTIFLLSMRSGAFGINLTQANRVFLLEPAMNPSLAAQAVGRVHRLGQTRPVEIVRLLMKDSIDTRINHLLATKYGHTPSADVDETSEETKNMDDSPSVVLEAPVVGSLRTDKVDVLKEEFDFLFGLKSSLVYPTWRRVGIVLPAE